MQEIMATTRGLKILFNVHVDKFLGLIAVGGALVAGAWLCSLALL